MYIFVEVVGFVRWRLVCFIDRYFKFGNFICGVFVYCGYFLYVLEGVDCSGIDVS